MDENRKLRHIIRLRKSYQRRKSAGIPGIGAPQEEKEALPRTEKELYDHFSNFYEEEFNTLTQSIIDQYGEKYSEEVLYSIKSKKLYELRENIIKAQIEALAQKSERFQIPYYSKDGKFPPAPLLRDGEVASALAKKDSLMNVPIGVLNYLEQNSALDMHLLANQNIAPKHKVESSGEEYYQWLVRVNNKIKVGCGKWLGRHPVVIAKTIKKLCDKEVMKPVKKERQGGMVYSLGYIVFGGDNRDRHVPFLGVKHKEFLLNFHPQGE